MLKAWQNIMQVAKPGLDEFLLASKNVEDVQSSLLFDILTLNQNSDFAQKYNFSKINSVQQYQQEIPVQNYAELAPFISKKAKVEALINNTSTLWFEPTGGSSGGLKLIPYNQYSLKAFHKALSPWLADLLQHRPKIAQGTVYFSLSPAMTKSEHTAKGIPIGCDNDLVYFEPAMQAAFSELICTPLALSKIQDYDQWSYLSLRYLLHAQDLSFISVWSPTFLLQLLKQIPKHKERLLKDIREGVFSYPVDKLIDLPIPSPNPELADRCEQAFSADSSINTKLLWPLLDTISCWADSSANRYIAELQALFPTVYIQGKGLLATEGFMSIPLSSAKAPVLSVISGFYEFVDVNENILLGHELEVKKQYRVILTNMSGLYRYDTEDIIEVVAIQNSLPAFRFIGRAGVSSDLCGEKLNDVFVTACLQAEQGFVMLKPLMQENAYQIIIDEMDYSEIEREKLVARINTRLVKNPQYSYALKMGQLAKLQLKAIPQAEEQYVAHCLKQGQLLGDIKIPALCVDSSWLTEA